MHVRGLSQGGLSRLHVIITISYKTLPPRCTQGSPSLLVRGGAHCLSGRVPALASTIGGLPLCVASPRVHHSPPPEGGGCDRHYPPLSPPSPPHLHRMHLRSTLRHTPSRGATRRYLGPRYPYALPQGLAIVYEYDSRWKLQHR